MSICIAQPLFDVFSCNTSVKEKPSMLSSPIIRIPHIGTLLLAKGKLPPSGLGGGTSRKIGPWGVQPTSQNSYPIYDQNVRLSYLWSEKVTWYLNLKNIPRLECKNHTLFMTKIDTLRIYDQHGWNLKLPVGVAHTYLAHMWNLMNFFYRTNVSLSVSSALVKQD